MRAWLAQKGIRRTEPEHELRDAISRPGCPVCRLALRTAARQLDVIAYESVNDLALRGRLRAARGFCRRHAWQYLEETRDPLGTALIYRDIVNSLLRELEPGGPLARLQGAIERLRPGGERPSADSGLARRLRPSDDCPICIAQRQTEADYLTLLGAQLRSAEWRSAYLASDGLCWPHLPRGLAASETPEAAEALVSRRLARAPFQGPDSAVRWLAAEFGTLQAPRPVLPSDLVVDVQRRSQARVERPEPSAELDCPVCRALAADSGATRGDAHPSLAGWCDRHAWQLADGRSDLAGPLALLARQRDRALAEAQALAGASDGRAVESRVAKAAAVEQCSRCVQASAAEAGELAAFLAAVERGEDRQDGGLCLRHLAGSAEASLSLSARKRLLGRQSAEWGRLSAELSEFIRKHDYRFQSEPRGAERASPWRAVEAIAGPPNATVG